MCGSSAARCGSRAAERGTTVARAASPSRPTRCHWLGTPRCARVRHAGVGRRRGLVEASARGEGRRRGRRHRCRVCGRRRQVSRHHRRGELVPGRTGAPGGARIEWAMFAHGAAAVAFETIVAAGANSAVPAPPSHRCCAVPRRLREDRPAARRRRLSLRHDPHLQCWAPPAAGSATSATSSVPPPRQGARPRGRARNWPLSTPPRGRSSTPAATGRTSCTALATGRAADPRSPVRWVRRRRVHFGAVQVVTVEPGVYLPGRGGVRIEDTVVVSEALPILTATDRAFTVLG